MRERYPSAIICIVHAWVHNTTRPKLTNYTENMYTSYPRPLPLSELKYLDPQPYTLVTPSLAGKNRLGPKLPITPPTRGKSGTRGVVLGEFIFGRRR